MSSIVPDTEEGGQQQHHQQQHQQHAYHSPTPQPFVIPQWAITAALGIAILIVGYFLVRGCKRWLALQLALYGAVVQGGGGDGGDKKARRKPTRNEDSGDDGDGDDDDDDDDDGVRFRAPSKTKKRSNY
jgi:hypothetical protein